MPGNFFFFFGALSPHFPLAGVSFQCEPLGPALNFPKSPCGSPNSSSSSTLPSLCPLHPPSWYAARGAGWCLASQSRNVCVSKSPGALAEGAGTKTGIIWQPAPTCLSLTCCKGPSHCHLPTRLKSPLNAVVLRIRGLCYAGRM